MGRSIAQCENRYEHTDLSSHCPCLLKARAMAEPRPPSQHYTERTEDNQTDQNSHCPCFFNVTSHGRTLTPMTVSHLPHFQVPGPTLRCLGTSICSSLHLYKLHAVCFCYRTEKIIIIVTYLRSLFSSLSCCLLLDSLVRLRLFHFSIPRKSWKLKILGTLGCSLLSIRE